MLESQFEGRHLLDELPSLWGENGFRQLLERLPAGAYSCNADGLITYFNAHAVEIWGRAPKLEDAEDRFCGSFKLFLPDGSPLEHANCWMALALRDEAGYNGCEIVIERPDGSRVTALAHANPIHDPSGRLLGAINVLVDITSRKRMEETLLHHKQEMDDFFENASVGLHWVGPDGVILRANRCELDLLGYREEEYVGHYFGEFYADPSVAEEILRRLSEGEELHDEEARLRAKDGSIKHVLINANVLWEDGRFVHTRCFVRDVTERKRREETARFLAEASAALAELTDRDSVLERIADLAVPFFADWCAVDLRAAEGLRRLAVTHLDPAKVELAHELHHRYPPNPANEHGSMKVLRTGEPDWMAEIPEAVVREAAHDEHHFESLRELGLASYICVPLRLHGEVLGVLTFVTAESRRRYDESDLRAAEDLAGRAAIALENASLLRTLTDANQRKDEFLAMLAHELRNPLAPVRNAVHILRSKGPAEPELEWARDMIDRQVGQMTRLIDDLLDLSRITRGKIELHQERIELATVIENAVEVSRPAMEKAGLHRLEVSLPSEPIYLEADPTRLSQALLNLLNNAIKYTDRGGRVRLTAEVRGAHAVVRVEDTGIGIPAEMLASIFDMFTQVDRSLERSQGGLGIGLTLVKRVAEMHGGSIEARSDGPGRGSEFILRLPLAERAEEGGPQVQADPTTERAASAGLRVLVVDDNTDAADSLGMLLRISGHDVRTAHDGLAAVGTASVFRPDVVLLDIGLPKLNGYDAARRIRDERGDEVSLIAITGWGQDEDRRRSLAAGFDHHLTKPVDFEALKRLLAETAPEQTATTG